MPQTSIAYGAARIHPQSRALLDQARIQRMIMAKSAEDARRILVEAGLITADGERDAEAIAEERLLSAVNLVKAITPQAEATDCFLLRYDGMNLKMLFKARMRGTTASRLSRCGVLSPETLGHAVAQRKYGALPGALDTALTDLEKILTKGDDPLAIDQRVDGAIAALISEKLANVKSEAIRHYFNARADMLGAIALIRTKHLGRDVDFLTAMLLPGGGIPKAAYIEAFKKPETLAKKLLPHGIKVADAYLAALAGGSHVPILEKAMDDALLAPFAALKGSIYRLEPIAGYLLGAEREAKAIRLIFAGHQSGIRPDYILERMVTAYGG